MGIIENGLLRSIALDDKQAFEQIYRQYWSKLYIYAFNVLPERELCEDIVQEVFTDLWERRRDVRISDLNSYLHQSVKYQIFNHFRKSKYKKQLLLRFDLMSNPSGTDQSYEKRELKAQVRDAISQLPGQRRIVFEMSRYEGLSNKEISENLNISLQTVKNQISESLKSLRESLLDFYLSLF